MLRSEPLDPVGDREHLEIDREHLVEFTVHPDNDRVHPEIDREHLVEFEVHPDIDREHLVEFRVRPDDDRMHADIDRVDLAEFGSYWSCSRGDAERVFSAPPRLRVKPFPYSVR